MHQRHEPTPTADAAEVDPGADAATERADRVLLHLVLCSGAATLLLALASGLLR